MLAISREEELYKACRYGDWTLVKHCLESGVEVQEVERLHGSLIQAVMPFGDGTLLNYLISNGAILRLHHLHFAALIGNQNVILCIQRHFLERCWPLQSKLNGLTPLEILENRIIYPQGWDDPLTLKLAKFGLTYFSDEP